MQKIDLFKVEQMFESFKGKHVQVNVVGTIIIPFYINSFDFDFYKDEISFGEEDECDGWFRIDLDELVAIYMDYDAMTYEDKIVFETISDIFRTDCQLPPLIEAEACKKALVDYPKS